MYSFAIMENRTPRIRFLKDTGLVPALLTLFEEKTHPELIKMIAEMQEEKFERLITALKQTKAQMLEDQIEEQRLKYL